MRIQRPGPLRLDRRDLLRDAKDRLLARLPALEGAEVDPTDPGWLLLEQAAWMAEQLSERLDRYPLAVLQELLHLFGGRLRGAVPAVTAVALLPRDAGLLRADADQPAAWRFFAPQTESRDQLEFVPAETGVPVRPLRRARLWRWDGRALEAAAPSGPEAVVLPGAMARSPHFDGERIELSVLGADGDDIGDRLLAAVNALRASGVGWLQLEVKAVAGGSRASVFAGLDAAAAFAASAPGGFTTGEPLIGRWASLDESTWTPPVRVAPLPVVPRALRGRAPDPGREEGVVELHGLPAGIALAELFSLPAAPLPGRLGEDLWRTLARIEPRLAGLRVSARRVPATAAVADAPWLGAALAAGAFAALTGGRACELLELHLAGTSGALRVALAGTVAPREAWALGADGGWSSEPVPARPCWTLRAAGPDGALPLQVVEIPLPAGANTVVLRLDPGLQLAFPNPLLVINAPVVRDGRAALVRRAVPEPVSLLEADIVGPEERDRLAARPLGEGVSERVAALPLARFEQVGGGAVDDFHGVDLEARSGSLRLNAPDREGVTVDLPPGAELTLHWYRRTDGALGNIAAGELRLVEQAPSTRPALLGAINPVGGVGGEDREADEAARDRLFSPVDELMALPADWERAIRAALGGAGWRVRVWTHSERALLSCAWWSAPEGLPRALAHDGPDTLLVCVGREDGPPTAAELARAEAVVEGVIAQAGRRASRVRRARVAPLHAVLLEGSAGGRHLPTHDTTGLRGQLLGAGGRREPVPVDVLLLDAWIAAAPAAVVPGARL